ncbi:MAG: glycosyltransferase [Candidatus Omnitrophota bacterium]|jgi:glycosyltransferase involved in cell wall biosynthesis|nr:MAG: glycosyltransferase [Candidatus Omnitrophota bacterium]
MPKISASIIIPTFNKANILKMVLSGYLAQAKDTPDFEIIILDDASKDKTGEVVACFSDKLNIKYIKQSLNRGANYNRNIGIEAAVAELLIFADHDLIPSPDMVKLHVYQHELDPSESLAVLGNVKTHPEISGHKLSFLFMERAWHGIDNVTRLTWRYFITCNLSIRKKFIEENGKFDENVMHNDDVELGYRLFKHGLEIKYNPEIAGYHYHPLDFDEYMNIAQRDGAAVAYWLKKSPQAKGQLLDYGIFSWSNRPGKLIKHALVIAVFNKFTFRFMRKLALLLTPHGNIARYFYGGIYLHRRRETIKKCLRNNQTYA